MRVCQFRHTCIFNFSLNFYTAERKPWRSIQLSPHFAMFTDRKKHCTKYLSVCQYRIKKLICINCSGEHGTKNQHCAHNCYHSYHKSSFFIVIHNKTPHISTAAPQNGTAEHIVILYFCIFGRPRPVFCKCCFREQNRVPSTKGKS